MQLLGRTDNDAKSHWNTKLKKLLSMGIDPVIQKSFSDLMAEIASTLPSPQVAHLAKAALGCFKYEMLHLLTNKHNDGLSWAIMQEPVSEKGWGLMETSLEMSEGIAGKFHNMCQNIVDRYNNLFCVFK